MIELEKTYLVSELPPNLGKFPAKEIIDIYIPAEAEHPTLRVRKNGDFYEMTKKFPQREGDASQQKEETIRLAPEEFRVLTNLPGRRLHKTRYYYPYREKIAEIDVFQGDLEGLVLADIEFNTIGEKDEFPMPEFCLAEVTQEEFCAGGKLCGKSYADIERNLAGFNYKKISGPIA